MGGGDDSSAGRFWLQLAGFQSPRETDAEGRTPLMHVLNMGHFFEGMPAIARGLISQMRVQHLDLQVHSGNIQRGFCAMHYVSGPSSYLATPNKQILALLLRRRATMELRTEMGVTPLLMAVGQGQVNVAEAPVAARADIHAVSWDVPEKGKTERNVMNMGRGSSGKV